MKFVVLMLVISLAALPAAAQPSPLQVFLARTVAEFPGHAGIWVKHLTSGESAGIQDTELFNSASVIKLPVLVLAFQMADRGQLKLDERITITQDDLRGGSGIFRYHDTGLQPTFRDVLLQMVITSDNTATDLSIAKVGGVAKVNAWLSDKGYAPATGSGSGGGLRLVQTTGELFAKYNALTPTDDRNGKTNSDRAYWLGEISARATGQMLEAIEKKTMASPASCDAMLRMLGAQQAGQRRLNHYLSVSIAHKTGDFPPVLANDVGIIYARSGPIVVSFLGNAITGHYGEAEDRIGRFAQRLVEYFDK